jgi:hypothetical protein
MEYFAAADRVVIPYRKFRYSSGILANAIGAGRAVIAADHGEIGRAVAELGVGELYPHGSVTGLAAALGRALAEGGAGARAPRAALADADRGRGRVRGVAGGIDSSGQRVCLGAALARRAAPAS